MADQPIPLWLIMCEASSLVWRDDGPGPHETAAEIEALRDYIAPEEPEPTYLPGAEYTLIQTYIRWQERQRIRSLLTIEAEKARRGNA